MTSSSAAARLKQLVDPSLDDDDWALAGIDPDRLDDDNEHPAELLALVREFVRVSEIPELDECPFEPDCCLRHRDGSMILIGGDGYDQTVSAYIAEPAAGRSDASTLASSSIPALRDRARAAAAGVRATLAALDVLDRDLSAVHAAERIIDGCLGRLADIAADAEVFRDTKCEAEANAAAESIRFAVAKYQPQLQRKLAVIRYDMPVSIWPRKGN